LTNPAPVSLRDRPLGRYRGSPLGCVLLNSLFTLLLLLILPITAQGQSDEEKAREQLEQLEREIKRINRDISSASGKRNKLHKQLRNAEVELGKLQRQTRDTRKGTADNEKQLAELESRRDELETARDSQQARIALELKTAWQMGNQGQLKVLLNQEDPDTIARMMGYYRYFFEARRELLDEFRDTLASLDTVQQDINTTLAKLEDHASALEKQSAKIADAQKERQAAVHTLNTSIASSNTALQKKKADRKELEALLSAIEEAVDKLELPSNYQAFGGAKGKMPWPVKGKFSNRFGKTRNEGGMRWQGVTINAKEGTTVHAIHHGRVVYADWLRGSGLLLIIDHGDGYMSLYAHNQALLKDVGEWVSAGTPISSVGTTGGRERAALYFEIRKNGKPTNPAKWCTG
jgi:murein hydrolase activator